MTRTLANLWLVLVPLALASAQTPNSFQGTFSHDDEKRSFSFSLTRPTTVLFTTNSYAAGGFDPTLSLYDGTGALIANNRDGGCSLVAADPATGNCWDAYLSIALPPGSYQLVLTIGENLPNGPTLADAFVYEGQGDYTTGPGGIGPAGLWDASGSKRTGSFGLDIVGPGSVTAQLVLSRLTPPSGQEGVAYSYQFISSGGSGAVTYTLASGTLPVGLTLSAAGLLSGNAAAYGTYDFTILATDSAEPAATDSQPYRIVIAPAALVITTVTPLPAGIGAQAYTPLAFTSAGGLNGNKLWALVSGSLPGGMTFSSAGVLQGTPAATGSASFTVSVTDDVQTAQKAFTVSVFAPLTITTNALPGGTQGTFYGPVSLAATGGSGSVVWSSSSLPPGVNVTSGGQVSGSPGAPGTFAAIITATDTTAGQTAGKTFQISIAAPLLTIAPVGDLGSAVGGAISKLNSASGGKPPYTWSASGLPAGVGIDSSSGLISGSPTVAGKFTFTVTATDIQGLSASTGGTMSVLGFVSGTLPNGTTVDPYSQTVVVTGGTPPYTFTGIGVPDGLTLSSGGALTGTSKKAGSFAITVRVSDATGVSASAVFTLNVTAPQNLSVSGAPLGPAVVGKPYSDTVGANGFSGGITWTVAAGTLPDGLSLSTSGTLSGTPTKDGTFAFIARATDSSGASATGAFSVAVAPQPLTLSLNSFPLGYVGIEYPQQVTTPGGGAKPYAFSLTGSLPPGLKFDAGQITGTPTAVGTSEFTINVTDSSIPALNASVKLSITTVPNAVDLVLSSSSASFAVFAGAGGLPNSQAFTVRSSSVLVPLNYSVAPAPAVQWATFTGGGSTPGNIIISLTSAALSLSSGTYTTGVAVTCVAPSPCAGKTQTINVSLSVTSPPPLLSVGAALLSFAASAADPIPAPQSFTLENQGGGSIGIVAVTADAGWLKLGGLPTSLTAGAAASVDTSVDTTGLRTGYYRTTISIRTSAGSVSLPVGLFYSRDVSMNLSPGGAQLQMQAGGALGKPTGSFLVSANSSESIAFTAAALPGTPWLKLATTEGTASATAPGVVRYSIDQDAAAALAPNAYYGVIRITSGRVANSPQDFNVILNITSASDPVKPDPQPAGLIFISSAPGAIPGQTVTVYASSRLPIPYQASASTETGGAWLQVSPATGTTSAAEPAESNVSVKLTGLAQGVYRGGVSYAFSGAAVRTVNVTLIVQAGGAAQLLPELTSRAVGCTPTKLVPTHTGIPTNFAQPAAWPTPISVKLLDDCGTVVPNGQIVTTFSNGDPPMALQAVDKTSGVFAGTWTPRATSSQITVTARATASGFTAATTVLKGQVTPNAAPALNPGGTLNAFGPLLGAPLGPGSIVQIYGSNLSAQPNTATALPLPEALGGTKVLIGGKIAPLYFASSSQVNAQIPVDLVPNEQYQIVVSANGALSTPEVIHLTDVAPGIASFANGAIIAQHLDGTLVLSTAPAKPGEFVIFYLSGLGLTDVPVDTGQASPGDILAHPTEALKLSLNGIDAPIAFVGLTPGLVGLYQVNFKVPENAPDGDLDLLITQNDLVANKTIVPVRK